MAPSEHKQRFAAMARWGRKGCAGVTLQNLSPLVRADAVNQIIGREELNCALHYFARGVLRNSSKVWIAASCEIASAARSFLTSSAVKRSRVAATPSLGTPFRKLRTGFFVRFLSCMFRDYPWIPKSTNGTTYLCLEFQKWKPNLNGESVILFSPRKKRTEKGPDIKWEYRIESMNIPADSLATVQEQLNELGASGWEIVTVWVEAIGSFALLKRPK